MATENLNQMEAFDEIKTETPSGYSQSIKRVKLDDFAFEQAGLYRGDSIALENQLSWIKEGHLVDLGYDEKENNLKKRKLVELIAGKDKEITNVRTEQQKIKEVAIPENEESKALLENEISDIKISVAEKRMKTDFNMVRFILLTSLSVLVGFYLIFFYASAMNAAFFRNMQSLLSGGNRSDVELLMDSIFDPVGIFQGGAKLLFIYLGSFVFFGLGLIPHSILAAETRNKSLKVVLFLTATLAIESLIAYKIDKSLHFVTEQISMSSTEWHWYISPNFYLVLAFGFGAYLLWGSLFELTLKEWNKRDVDAKAALLIKRLKENIKQLKAELKQLNEEFVRLEGEHNRLKQEIENLKNLMNHAVLNPDELRRNLENYFSGWLRYLTGANVNNELKNKCREVFIVYRTDINNSLNPLNN